MAKVPASQELQPSVLDRLLDDDPGSRQEAPLSYTQKLNDLHQSVRRDLQDLLNARQRCAGWPPACEQLQASLVNYGLPDFMTANLATRDGRQAFGRVLQETIRQWEPRLDNVKVSLTSADVSVDRVLRYRITALLRVEPAPEPIEFSSSLEPITGNFTVTEGGRV